eukprot:3359131-Alexandrium_andersonii.AAC.1
MQALHTAWSAFEHFPARPHPAPPRGLPTGLPPKHRRAWDALFGISCASYLGVPPLPRTPEQAP